MSFNHNSIPESSLSPVCTLGLRKAATPVRNKMKMMTPIQEINEDEIRSSFSNFGSTGRRKKLLQTPAQQVVMLLTIFQYCVLRCRKV